jgi:hypothetical protein
VDVGSARVALLRTKRRTSASSVKNVPAVATAHDAQIAAKLHKSARIALSASRVANAAEFSSNKETSFLRRAMYSRRTNQSE